MRRFAISDIHGCARSFEALLDKIAFSSEDELFLLGDYIDRGPDSKGVIDLILRLKEEGHRLHCLLGNHEELMLETLGGLTEPFITWLYNGGGMTMESFGLRPTGYPHDIPDLYIRFLKQLEWHAETEGYILVHAGLDLRAADPLEAAQAMLWIRDWREKADPAWLQGRVVVHGHTPIPQPMIEQQLKGLETIPVLDIDAGCVFNNHYLNQLCAFELDNRRLYFQKNIDTDG